MRKITQLKAGSLLSAILILFECMVSAMLFGQAPSLPTQQATSAAKLPGAGVYANTDLTYKIIYAPEHTFCYDVFANSKLMIHQTSIPALSGNKGFTTKADAEKVAQLVIGKIKKGEMPPTVSIDEMKKLKVIK